MAGATGSGPARRYDPDRRSRIIEACLDVIATDGVDGTSHRKVAAAADVPLGSMTYHFSGMEELLHEAFTRFAVAASERLAERMAAAHDAASAQAIMADLILESGADQRDLVLTHELYTLAARRPAFRDITHAWMARSRAVFEQYNDPGTARILDALNEGLIIHRALDLSIGSEPFGRTLIETAIRRVVSESPQFKG